MHRQLATQNNSTELRLGKLVAVQGICENENLNVYLVCIVVQSILSACRSCHRHVMFRRDQKSRIIVLKSHRKIIIQDQKNIQPETMLDACDYHVYNYFYEFRQIESGRLELCLYSYTCCKIRHRQRAGNDRFPRCFCTFPHLQYLKLPGRNK